MKHGISKKSKDDLPLSNQRMAAIPGSEEDSPPLSAYQQGEAVSIVDTDPGTKRLLPYASTESTKLQKKGEDLLNVKNGHYLRYLVKVLGN